MPEWLDHPVWSSLAEVAGSTQGVALIVTIAAAVAVGAFIGFVWGRQRSGAPPAESPENVGRSTEVAEISVAANAMREHLSNQGLSGSALERCVRAFEANLKTAHGALNALNAEDPETTPLIHAAKRSLDEGEFDEAVGYLTGAREKFVLARKSFEDAARGRAKAASRTAVLVGDLELARRNYDAAAEQFSVAVDNVEGDAENEIARLLTKQGTATFKGGDRQNAANILETAAKLVRRSNGRDHPEVAKALNRLALVRFASGQMDAAERLYRRAVSIDEKALGSDHSTVATDLNNLAQLLVRKGEMDEARPLLRRVLEIREKALGANHGKVRRARRNFLNALRALKAPRDAKRIAAPDEQDH
ncbi:MAG: tetratricopeptide repeat protein [Rhodospirillales bacterium]|nr:tetratricopeptide repeat protein [Rhodospirillales bacterium]